MPEPAPEPALAELLRAEALRAAQQYLDQHPDGSFGDLTAAIAAATMGVVADGHDRSADLQERLGDLDGRLANLAFAYHYRECAAALAPRPPLRVVGGGAGG